VLAHNGDALLLERAPPGRTLVELSRNGRDDEATRIACDVVVKLRVVPERRRR
jgi:streptomycin 6-kinase